MTWGDAAQQCLAADCLQRPLRFRFRQQLKAGVRLHRVKWNMYAISRERKESAREPRLPVDDVLIDGYLTSNEAWMI
jgi:hypothetical protein